MLASAHTNAIAPPRNICALYSHLTRFSLLTIVSRFAIAGPFSVPPVNVAFYPIWGDCPTTTRGFGTGGGDGFRMMPPTVSSSLADG